MSHKDVVKYTLNIDYQNQDTIYYKLNNHNKLCDIITLIIISINTTQIDIYLNYNTILFRDLM